ncbi:general substrate transporter [Yarrowia lipolytica]|jgi:sugar porter (SP) family MFS transporter|uniref:YALI0E20427p n=2 Tax=Yarrowia lipolytica TaxID=4952 RepID=Q6C576_YARLI|nr:YALI0E20427p [Yarrowia lipolytica CLIB122]KAB8286071.1 general substrate transporter [Yarrowia lipolytica]KAE8171619.1 general substrate transporter [Yarrowia lipolytica]KAJ8057158.1 general substrate transporter [Yarrowia lipolytica]RDW28188.1 general substrate transporter [Yarrowia lipolytica]RDW35526.1 general substrate transporter [Yarrowia lipolytica]|eukprot:XP_504186.1 YALI0E20427p [Yarrowia lipolytica CLIB122]
MSGQTYIEGWPGVEPVLFLLSLSTLSLSPPAMFWISMKNEPKQVLNRTLWFAIFVFGLLGTSRGLDEGNISGTVAQPSFISKFKLHDPSLSKDAQANLLSNITSMVQIGSVAGALIAMLIVDRIGRLWALREMLVIWIVGVIVQITSNNVGQLYAGRFVAGMGIGQSVVIGPTYLAEIAPPHVRGLATCVFSGSVYLGVMLSYFANYGTTLHISNTSRNQWVIPTTLQIIFSGIMLIGSIFVHESPRWLMKIGKEEEAVETLCKIRKLPADDLYVQGEILMVREQIEREKQAMTGASYWSLFKELLATPANRYRLFLGLMIQILGQWSGANAITIYAPSFFQMIGVSGQQQKMFATAILGVVKFAASIICAVFLIDTIGRRRSLYSGITLQFISILYVAIYLAVVPNNDPSRIKSAAERHAGVGAIAFIYLSGVGWALGWNSIQYLINAEIYTVRHRSLASGLIMTVHFANQYGNSKALPSMRLGMTDTGAMFFFSGIILVGLVWSWFFLPEVSGRSLESIDEMFSLPWYLIGRRGHQMVPETSAAVQIAADEDEKKGGVVHVENC